MKIFSSILFIAILFMPLMADKPSGRILITKTSKKSNLHIINSKLSQINVKMYIVKSHDYYMVYSKVYYDYKVLQKLLKKIKTQFPSSVVVLKKETKKNKKTKNKTLLTDITSSKQAKSNFALNLSVGSNSLSGNTSDLNTSTIDNSSLSYSLELCYYYNKNLYSSIAYLNSSTDDIDVASYYTSLNYEFTTYKDITLYGGGVVGISTLRLSGYKNSKNSMSNLVGINLGSHYHIYKQFYLYATYQYLYFEQIINLDDTSKNINFDSIQNIALGISFKF